MLGGVEAELFWQGPLLVRVILWLNVSVCAGVRNVWHMSRVSRVSREVWRVLAAHCPPCSCCSCSVMLIDSQMMSRWPEDCCLYTPSSSRQWRYRLGSHCCCLAWPGLGGPQHTNFCYLHLHLPSNTATWFFRHCESSLPKLAASSGSQYSACGLLVLAAGQSGGCSAPGAVSRPFSLLLSERTGSV